MSRDTPSSMIGRVVALLDAVAAAGTVSRGDLARATGLPQATCNRIVARLVAERLLTERAGVLRLGLRLFELGTQASQAGVTLVDIAGPYLLDLHGMLGWTTQLAVLDDAAVVYLVKIDSRRRPRLGTRVAGRFPPHCTGAGKALLAFSPPELVDDVIDRTPLTARTPDTITDRAHLLSELRATRRRGYAIDRAEFQTGMTAVAVPIRPGMHLVGALTVAGPTESFDPSRAAHAARVVAQMIESRLAAGP
ncbi:IclR family transcriptional regulator [Dactylosporangium fulvum]|uniref:IclR family transcriptional regulator n=1 Tax=Dactylosporangium fulvum TaxID=53359 RepID=A0ABY5VPJ3_9ACTN|nr:IclR family transcriptional regulator [Dactylosporangium fulvum]UWP79613.1 IclR family transcriptional regulator [Dactylosporangium fulvum]